MVPALDIPYTQFASTFMGIGRICASNTPSNMPPCLVTWPGCMKSVSRPHTNLASQACVQDLDSALRCCEEIGYPCMLKASWGGGGKGIRRCMNEDDVRMSFKQVSLLFFCGSNASLARHVQL